MNGWIKLHRELIEKPIWTASTPEQKVILITLLMMANHEGKEWEFKGKRYKAEPGQFITSLASIAKNAGEGISIKNVRTALLRFEKYDFLANESTNRNRLITIVNWGLYQGSENEKADNGQATGRQPATNKNVRTIKDLKDSSSEKIPDKKKAPKTEVVKFTETDLENAKLLNALILENNPGAKSPNIGKWADVFRLIRVIDGREDKTTKYLIHWSQKDSFWKSNIMSPDSLRKQFDRLFVKAKEEHEYKQYIATSNTTQKPKPSDFDAFIEKLKREEEENEKI